MFKVLLVLAALLFPSVALAECPGSMTKTQFFSYVDKNSYKPFTLTAEGRDKLVVFVNRIRDKNHLEPFPSSAEFYFAELDQQSTGIVWIVNGCVVKETFLTLPTRVVFDTFVRAGLGEDSIVVYKTGVPL